jgi:predicted dehydrogenase
MERPPRCVVVGAGAISWAWFPPLQAEAVEVATVVELDVELARRRRAEHGLEAEVSDDLAATLRRTQPDFVLDLTQPTAHEQVTLTALQHGCHVLGEKPMAPDLATARRMVAAAERSGRLYVVSQSRRWVTAHERIRRAVASGAIGTVTNLDCGFWLAAHFGGFRDRMAHPLLLDMAIHHLDMARFLTGLDAVSVLAREHLPAGSWWDGAPAAAAIFELTGNVQFSYSGSWAAEGCHTGWNGDWRIVGTGGSIVYRGDALHAEVVDGPGDGLMLGHRPLELDGPTLGKEEMHGSLAEFLADLREGRRPQCECHDNFASLAMVHAAVASAEAGRVLAVETL